MITTRIFQGIPDHPGDKGGTVLVLDPDNGDATELDLRLDLCDHSPTGFAWGYEGSGPAQLALAILAEVAGDDDAIRYYQDFKFDVVAALQGTWSLHEEFVKGWLCRRKHLRPEKGD